MHGFLITNFALVTVMHSISDKEYLCILALTY